MKKVIFISVAVILLGLAGYVFFIKKFANNRAPLQPVSQTETKAPSQPSPTTTFDTNDNLNQALQDLDQINNF